MAEFDISLLGKRYPELNPTSVLGSDTLISVYKTGEPELNKIIFLDLQKNIELKKTKDFIDAAFTDAYFPRWSNSQGKFILGNVLLEDIPDLPASKITSGVFDISRIPDLSISKIINLQTELDGKEPVFDKGDIVSSTFILTNNIGRLYGSENLGIELDISQFEDLFVPASRKLTFISATDQLLVNGVWGTSIVLDLSTDRTIELEANFTQYVHPNGFTSLPTPDPLMGAFVISQLNITNEGHVEDIQTRELTKADIGLGNVDNTSDPDKPISIATQIAIDALDDRFLRKDNDDNNGSYTLTLGNLVISTLATFIGIGTEENPDFNLAIMANGSVVKTSIITPGNIADLQDQIDALQIQINDIVQDKHYSYNQSIPSNVWGPINHGLEKRPSIDVYDTSNNKIFAYEVDHIDLNNCTITFSANPSDAVAGRADFN